MTRVVVYLLLGTVLLAGAADAQTMAEWYGVGVQARADGDHAGYRDAMTHALELEPGHPVLQIHLARAFALLDEPEPAAQWLGRAFSQGAWVDVEADPWLEKLRASDAWPAVRDLAAKVGAHRGRAEVGFELDDHLLLPEGIAHDPRDGAFYLGSMRQRKIVRRGADGHVEDFVASAQDGLLCPLGLRVDAAARRLWAVASAEEQVLAFTGDEEGSTGLWCWSLDDGALLGRWMVATDSLRHGLNDLALLDDGSVVVTDAYAGQLHRLDAGGSVLRPVLAPGTLRGPNGIIAAPDGRGVIVSEYSYGLTHVDLETGACVRVPAVDGVTTVGVDGLVLHEGALYAVQNYAGLDRAVRFDYDAPSRTVVGCEVLEARHPRMSDPTTCVVADGALWFIANSHISDFDPKAPLPTLEDWTRVLVLRVGVGR